MANNSIYFSDKKNINKVNFYKLFSYLRQYKIPFFSNTDDVAFKFNFGNYKSLKQSPQFSGMYSKYIALSNDEILHLTYKGIVLFDVYRNEALSYFLIMESFRKSLQARVARTDIFNAMISTDRDTLVMCACISIFWAKYWISKWDVISKYKYVGIFSGAQIFNMMLIEISKRSQFSPLIMESFFTGNEFYFEEKYEPLPNNTNLKFNNIYCNLEMPNDEVMLHDAIQKIRNKRNKNNTENQKKNISIDSGGKRVITIIAQVVNDFSVICTFKNYLNTIDFYKNAIDSLLENENNYVILKIHPWEVKKNKSKITYNEIQNHILTKPEGRQKRFKLIESWDINELCEHSDYIITLCSQAGIESAMRKKKVIQFGNAFYGGKGFTHDYTIFEDFMKDFDSGLISPLLSNDEMVCFNEFLVKIFSSYLISNKDSKNNLLDSYFRS